MKKYLLVAIVAFVVGCLSSSPKIIKDVINGTDSIRSSFESEISRIDNEIKLISQSYKVKAVVENKTETKESNISYDSKVIEAGSAEIFGCSPAPKKPEDTGKIQRLEPTISVLKKPVIKVPAKASRIVSKSIRPAIISVKADWELVDGRMMFTAWKVKLNKAGIDKVKIGAKVRIFIDYCYYEGDKIDKDGSVIVNLDWHPPLAPVKGKIGVSLFMQLNTPEIGSGIQYCSTIIKI